jgi:hypothetical protein
MAALKCLLPYPSSTGTGNGHILSDREARLERVREVAITMMTL